MIRRWIERWIGHDRLLVAYEKVKRENASLTRSRDAARRRHRNLLATFETTTANVQAQRRELAKLNRLYTRVLIDLEWERFLNEENENAWDPGRCVKIRLMDHDQAWEVADLLTERFRQPLFAYWCDDCPRNPITRSYWWHVTRKRRKRRNV